MIRNLLFIAIVSSTLGAADAAETPADYAYRSALGLSGDGPFYRLDLPAAVYEGIVRTDFADMRVFNASKEALPHAFLPRADPAREKLPAIALPMFPLFADRDGSALDALTLTLSKTAAGTTLSVKSSDGAPVAAERRVGTIVDASAVDRPLTALRVTLPPERRGQALVLRVDGSDDLVHWRTLAGEGVLLDLETAGQRLTQDRIELPAIRVRYLRLAASGGRPAFELASVHVETGERVIEPERQWKQVAGTPVSNHPGEIAYDLGGIFPVDRVTLAFSESNTVLPASLLVRASEKEPWRPVVAGVFYRLSQSGAQIDGPALSVSAGGARYWLLRVDPTAGSFGREPPQLRAGWTPHALVFAARGAAPFSLAYGSVRSAPGALPVATLVPGFEPRTEVLASFGVARVDPTQTVHDAARLRPLPDAKRWFLWSILLAGVALLAWMAWRLSRELRAPSAPAKDASQDTPSRP